MLDILIVDDEPLARERLLRLVQELGHEVIGTAANAAEAWDLIQTLDPSVALLDIEMPGETGLQLAKRVSELHNPPAVIFTTAYEKYALEAFSAFAAGYVLKPINVNQLQQALEKAQGINKAQLNSITNQNEPDLDEAVELPKHISTRSHRGFDLMPVETVRCLLADNKYITVITTEGEHLIDGTLKEFENQFAPAFVRVHRNALIPLAYIQGLERATEGFYQVRLKDIYFQPVVGRRYAGKLKQLLSEL